jgi:hypothetical protein
VLWLCFVGYDVCDHELYFGLCIYWRESDLVYICLDDATTCICGRLFSVVQHLCGELVL